MTRTVLHIDSSARFDGSITRTLSASVVQKLGGPVIRRDLTEAVPHVDADWINANFTKAEARLAKQRAKLALSDALVDELEAADVIVIGAPIYNFGVPASLKAWIDHIARVGRTFRYTAAGPEGLLKNKRAIIVTASGGTEVDSDIDFAIPYLRHVLKFIGITHVEIIAADQMAMDADASLGGAQNAVEALAA